VLTKLYEKLFSEIGSHAAAHHFQNLLTTSFNSQIRGYVPNKTENVTKVYPLIHALCKSDQDVVVVALDAISYDYYCNEMQKFIPKGLTGRETVLTSVFPSTTSTAWSSIITGKMPCEHGIYGTSFYDERFGDSYIWLDDSTYIDNKRVLLSNTELIPSKFKRIFQTINRTSYYIGHHGVLERNSLNDELIKGTKKQIYPNFSEYYLLKMFPDKLISYTFGEINKLCNTEIDNILIWAYFDLDDYIHQNGYDSLTLLGVWNDFFSSIKLLTDQGCIVLLISDHGQTKHTPCEVNLIDKINELKLSSIKASGAGNTIYTYGESPTIGLQEIDPEHLKKSIILTKKELFDLGLFSTPAIHVERIGDYVILANGLNAPTWGYNYVCEHGACSRDEMFVPCLLFQK
jgi:hypothetical protein